MSIVLCHKCSGVLASHDNEEIKDLSGCGCISGWVRGFEPWLTRSEAIEQQIKRAEGSLAFFQSQGRNHHYIQGQIEKIHRLKSLVV